MFLGAAFFVAYDFLKRVMEPMLPNQAPLAHMIAASGGEVVSVDFLFDSGKVPLSKQRANLVCLLDPSPN